MLDLLPVFQLLCLPVLLAAGLLLYLALRPTKYPGLPGPPLTAYLPGGAALAILRDPGNFTHSLLSFVRAHGRTIAVYIGLNEVLVTSDPADFVHITTSRPDFDRTTSAHTMLDLAMPGSLFTMPQSDHRRKRARLRQHFNHAILSSFHAPMRDAVDELLTELRGAVDAAPSASPGVSTALDMNRTLSTVTFRIILNVAFGAELSLAERAAFSTSMDRFTVELLREAVGLQFRRWLVPFGVRHRFWKHKRDIDAVISRIIQKRLAEPADARNARSADLLDSIIDMEGDNVVGAVAQGFLFAIAGSHTTNVTLSWCLYYASLDARVRRRILEEVDAVLPSTDDRLLSADVARLRYLSKVWKEALRLNPPAAMIGREARRDVRLKGSGVRVPRGGVVFAFSGASQRSPEHWDEPDAFIPERWGEPDAPAEADRVQAGAYAPFSLGPSNCVGQFMAEYEGVVILAELFRRFRFSLACEPHEVVSRSAWVQSGRYSTKKDGVYDMGIPMHVELR